MSRALRIAAVLVVAYAIVYAVESFTISSVSNISLPAPSDFPSSSSGITAFRLDRSSVTCGAALLGAWRADKPSSGWFGYAPLTTGPVLTLTRSGCRGPSRRRLQFSFAGGALGLGLAFVARRMDRDERGGDGSTAAPTD